VGGDERENQLNSVGNGGGGGGGGGGNALVLVENIMAAVIVWSKRWR
jgi:hypothetical protein